MNVLVMNHCKKEKKLKYFEIFWMYEMNKLKKLNNKKHITNESK